MHRFFCPNTACKRPLSAPPSKIGAITYCRYCNQQIQIPGVPAAHSPAQQPTLSSGPVISLYQAPVQQPAPPRGPATQLLGAFCGGDYDPFQTFNSAFGPHPCAPLSNPVVDELLSRDWRSLRGNDFEYFLVEVFQALGYEAEKKGKSHDKGLDVLLIIGNKRVCVQAKGYAGKVSDYVVGEALKGMKCHNCDFCVAITNSEFTGPAYDTAKKCKCGLIDGATLPDLIRGLFIPPAHVLLGSVPARPVAGMCLAYTTGDGKGRWWANLTQLGGPCLGPFPNEMTAHSEMCAWLMQHEPGHLPPGYGQSPNAAASASRPQLPGSLAPPPSPPSPNPFEFGPAGGSEASQSRSWNFLQGLAYSIGLIACELGKKTKRPRNGCDSCGHSWYPKGADLSRRCPNCGSAAISTHPEALAVGWVFLVVISVGISFGICAIPFLFAKFRDQNVSVAGETDAQRRDERLAISRPGPRGTDGAAPNTPPLDRSRQPVKSFQEALKNGNRGERLKAMENLRGLGSKAADTVPDLQQMLEEKDEELKIAAIKALAEVGPAARSAVPQLLSALTDGTDPVQRESATTLRRLNFLTASDIPLLDTAARGKSALVRLFAIETLGKLVPTARAEAAPVILTTLQKEDDSTVCQVALQALRQPDTLAETDVEGLTALLAAPTPSVRLFAAEALGKFGPASKNAVPALVQAMRDSELPVQKAAATALGTIGPDAQAAQPELVKAIQDREGKIQPEAAAALVKIGPDLSTAPVWIRAIKDNDQALAGHAAKALQQIGRVRKEDVPALLDLMKSDRPEVRPLVASLLGAMGTDSKVAIPVLIDGLRDPLQEVRVAVAVALGKIGASAWSAAPALGNVLRDDQPEVRKAAVGALVKLGPDARGATPSLISALKDGAIHEEAKRALVGIGKAAVGNLTDTLANSRDVAVRLNMVEILGQIGSDAKAAVPTLTTVASEDIADKNRKAAKEALAKIQRKP